MRVHKVSDGCEVNNCPTVYLTDRGTVVMQGFTVVAADGLALGDGEQAVELPLDVVLSALPALTRGR